MPQSKTTKTTPMRTLVTILCSILLVMSANAASSNRHRGSSSCPIPERNETTSSLIDKTLHSQSSAFAKKAVKKSMFHKTKLNSSITGSEIRRSTPAETGEELFQVYMDFIEPEGYMLLGCALGRPSLTYWDEAYDGMMLPAGDYCIAAIFAAESDGKPQKIIVKNFNLVDDTTISVDGNEATEKITFQPLLPDGTPVKGATLNEYWEVKEPGNISVESNGYINTAFYSPKWGLFFYYESTFGTFQDPASGQDIDQQEGANFLFNPDASGDMIASQYCSFFGEDNESCYLLQLNSKGMKSQTVNNTFADFNTTTYSEIMTTEYYLSGQDLIELPQMLFGWYMVVNGVPEYMNYAMGDLVDSATSLYYCIPEFNSSLPVYTIFPFVDNFDEGTPVDLGDVIGTPIYRIEPSAFRFINGKIHMMVAPMLDGPYNSNYFYTNNGIATDLVLNGQPTYSFANDQSLQIAGDNAPYLQIVDNSTPSTSYFEFQYLMLGRVGESPFLYSEELSSEFDGKTVSIRGTDYSALDNVWYPFWEDLNEKYNTYDGLVKLNVQSTGTIMVDGTIPSYARTENVWNFAQKEDRTAPQLTMFQFRNTGNIVTDRFEQASDGVLTLSCADFNNVREFIYNESGIPIGINQYAEFNGTPDVTVEYSPINRNDWQPIEVTEQPDEFYMPGYGSFFRGNLGSIDRKGVDGWFDIRFKLADNAGNTQTVVVSPAFNISSLAGINDVRMDKTVIRVEGKNIVAPDEAVVYNISGIRVGRNSLPSGIYLVNYKGNTTKCIII